MANEPSCRARAIFAHGKDRCVGEGTYLRDRAKTIQRLSALCGPVRSANGLLNRPSTGRVPPESGTGAARAAGVSRRELEGAGRRRQATPRAQDLKTTERMTRYTRRGGRRNASRAELKIAVLRLQYKPPGGGKRTARSSRLCFQFLTELGSQLETYSRQRSPLSKASSIVTLSSRRRLTPPPPPRRNRRFAAAELCGQRSKFDRSSGSGLRSWLRLNLRFSLASKSMKQWFGATVHHARQNTRAETKIAA